MARQRKTPVVRDGGARSVGNTARRNREPPRRQVPPSSCLPALALALPPVLPRSRSCYLHCLRSRRACLPIAFVAGAGGASPAPTPRRDSIICPARKCVSRCFFRPDAAQSQGPLARAFRLHFPWVPPRPSL